MAKNQLVINGKIKLVALVLLFLLPGVLAWYLFFFSDYGRHGKGAEYGVLIHPPRQLEDQLLMQINNTGGGTLHGKWSLLFFIPDDCGAICEQLLYRVRQVRLATGKHIQRVQRVAVVEGDVNALFSNYSSMHIKKELIGEDTLTLFADQDIDEVGAIFLVDPRGFLMMRYAWDTNPSGIIHDLSRLLRISTEHKIQ